MAQSGSYSSAQLAALLSAMQNDPLALGLATPFGLGDAADCCAILNWTRDGATPCPTNGIVGPNGTIAGATNASPIVITTSAPHGLTTGQTVVVAGVGGNTAANNIPSLIGGGSTVAPNPFWVVTVIDVTHFSLNGSTGNAAYTSGGTWFLCIGQIGANKIFNEFVSTQAVLANIASADIGAALTTTQQLVLAAILNPGGVITLTDALGNETSAAGWLQLLTTSGSVSRKAVKALESRFGSYGELVVGQPNYSNPGQAVSLADFRAAVNGHY